MALAVVGLPPLFTGGMIAANLKREDIPQYWLDAIGSFDAQPHDTRVLEVPGIDFASYRWGNTVDPITPGLMDRPYAARELIPYGSPPSTDLLNAFDRRLQENTLDPRAVSPIARLLGVGKSSLATISSTSATGRPPVPGHAPARRVARTRPADGFGPLGTNQPSAIAPLQDEAALRDDTGASTNPSWRSRSTGNSRSCARRARSSRS